MTNLETVLQARISKEDGIKFKALAAANHLTSSTFLRQIILMVLGDKLVVMPVKPQPDKCDLVKRSIYIPRFLLDAIEQRSKQQGMALSRWVASLIQSNLMSAPVVTDTELVRLRESIRELNYIGHNINQIAKALNENPHETDRVNLATLKTLDAAIEKNIDAIYVFIGAKNRAWAAKNELD
ncbi:MAG: plasmid mobilization relaxosome protein MobC [Methylococcales bacterium]